METNGVCSLRMERVLCSLASSGRTIYDFTVKDAAGKPVSMDEYRLADLTRWTTVIPRFQRSGAAHRERRLAVRPHRQQLPPAQGTVVRRGRTISMGELFTAVHEKCR